MPHLKITTYRSNASSENTAKLDHLQQHWQIKISRTGELRGEYIRNAGMLTSVLWLRYGLDCGEIVFRFPVGQGIFLVSKTTRPSLELQTRQTKPHDLNALVDCTVNVWKQKSMGNISSTKNKVVIGFGCGAILAETLLETSVCRTKMSCRR